MNQNTETGKRKKPGTRRLVQLYAALLYNANLKGFISGHIYTGDLKTACVPGLNCYSCPGAVAGCPLGSLQNALTAAGHTAPWYMMGMLILFGVMLGRTICGWLCPLGLIQELLHKIPTPKIRRSRVTRMLTWIKYIFLAVFVIALPLWFGIGKGLILPAFCKYICPAGTLEGAVGYLQHPDHSTSFYQLGALFTNKWVIMAIIGLACVFCYRSFCRFICPLGAIYSLFNRFALTGVKVNTDRCNGCGLCAMKCEMDVKHVGDRECISCGRCISTCPQGAISLQCGKITLKGPETGMHPDSEPMIRKRKRAARIAWGIAALVLVFALVWFNFVKPDAEKAAGTEVGEVLPDFSVKLLSGETFRLSDYRGRVVIINLWGTTCAPCIEEMPYFEQLKTAHPDVEILAVHNQAGASRAEAFLKEKEWDHLDFALDSSEAGVFRHLNAADAMPQTIVLDRQGIITYNVQAPVTYEKLEELYRSTTADTVPEGDGNPADGTGTAGTGAGLPGGGHLTIQGQKTEYAVRVTDPEGNPVAGVVIGFCTDQACRNGSPTDENGRTAITLGPDRYHLMVIDVPDGYAFPGETNVFIGPDSGEAVLTIMREE